MVPSWRCSHCIEVLIVEGVWRWVDCSIMAMPSLHCGSCCRGGVEVGRWFHQVTHCIEHSIIEGVWRWVDGSIKSLTALSFLL